MTPLLVIWLAYIAVPKNPPCFNGWVDRVALLCPGQEPDAKDIWPKPIKRKHRK